MTNKMMMLIAAGAMAAATAVGPAQARSFTTDPDATMHEQQKLGPNEVTTQLWGGGFVTQKVPPAGYMYGPAYGSAYGAPSYGYGYEYEPGYMGRPMGPRW